MAWQSFPQSADQSPDLLQAIMRQLNTEPGAQAHIGASDAHRDPATAFVVMNGDPVPDIDAVQVYQWFVVELDNPPPHNVTDAGTLAAVAANGGYTSRGNPLQITPTQARMMQFVFANAYRMPTRVFAIVPTLTTSA